MSTEQVGGRTLAWMVGLLKVLEIACLVSAGVFFFADSMDRAIYSFVGAIWLRLWVYTNEDSHD